MADTAAIVLGRILELIALASRDGGVRIDDAAERIGADPVRLLRDLELVLTREDYHPAGWVEDIRVEIGPESIRVFSSGKFDRPPVLSQREALALSLALRAEAMSRPAAEREDLLGLATRLDADLSAAPSAELWPSISVGDVEDVESLCSLFEEAIAERVRCRMRYLRPDEPEPSDREIDPHRLAYGGGKWFVIGHCLRHGELRVFRLDRILAAEHTTQRFEERRESDFSRFLDGGRVFVALETVPVTVHYFPRVEAWVREYGPVRETERGGVLVDYEVADPGWIVRQVLYHGAEAEVLEPQDVRDLVVESLLRQVE